jgi:hypothetical protein
MWLKHVLLNFPPCLDPQGVLDLSVQAVRRIPPHRNIHVLIKPVNPALGRSDFREWLDSPDWVGGNSRSTLCYYFVYCLCNAHCSTFVKHMCDAYARCPCLSIYQHVIPRPNCGAQEPRTSLPLPRLLPPMHGSVFARQASFTTQADASPRPCQIPGGEALQMSRVPSRRMAPEMSAYSMTTSKAGAPQQQQVGPPGKFVVKPMGMPTVAGGASRAAGAVNGGEGDLKPRRSAGSLTARISVGSQAGAADAGQTGVDGSKRGSLEARLKQVSTRLPGR